MRHHTAVPIDGGWRYASISKRGGYPLGYCGEHEAHPTESEARQCYRRWQRDHVALTDRESNWNDCAARPCKNPARKIAIIEGDAYAAAVLCDEHFTKEDAIKALNLDDDEAGDAWES